MPTIPSAEEINILYREFFSQSLKKRGAFKPRTNFNTDESSCATPMKI